MANATVLPPSTINVRVGSANPPVATGGFADPTLTLIVDGGNTVAFAINYLVTQGETSIIPSKILVLFWSASVIVVS